MGGIVDFEVRLPRARVSVHRMHRESGVPVEAIREITHTDGFPVLGEEESSWQLAAEAAKALLGRTATRPGDVRQVIFAGSGEWDVPFWSPAAKVAAELGIDDAHCFEVANFCNAGTVAIRIALDRLAGGGDGYALVLIADRLGQLVDYADPASKELFNFGDAAAAVLLSGRDTAFEVLHTATRTDPSWADYYYGEQRDGRLVIRRGPHRPGLADAYVDNFTRLVEETLKAVGGKRDDVAHFLINQGDRRMHERLLRELGLPQDRSVFNYDRLGHMGGADTLIALDGLRERRALRRGDLILLATSAMGFSWGVTALEYAE
ncbi:3-oxoacyl-ACP synthase III family protein [Streptosporangium saharense]|uniref:3-oxoacyl-[acyl-carrier-protein] synthase-3 n=1 Tax=Streptosporangium saharense TaxID=1706840 RepID=A0A7W7QPB3_9ACTN|nr:3-oxoacyl-[acyl-carrier-protein] synthase III C-terminal domain-containing protein [Streptosporangium saharense]MBB4917178.1 3-oxoacyl-[acyl-carrier-protein] synthase-3 [Streptosporangium saharense]